MGAEHSARWRACSRRTTWCLHLKPCIVHPIGMQAAEAAMGAEHSARALARLQQAHDLVARDGGGRQGRLAYHLAALMAREHLIANDAAAARRLLDSVAGAALHFRV